MTTANAPRKKVSAAESRRLLARTLLRALAVAAVLVTAYFVAPLDRLAEVPVGWFLAVGGVALIAVATYQVKAIIRAPHPGKQAIEALAIIVPLFLLFFSATYFMMTQTDTGSFSVGALTRIDALYFTITVFATVGFGDISATSQAARVLVTVQMLLDLVFIGLGLKVLLGAVKLGHQRTSDGSDPT